MSREVIFHLSQRVPKYRAMYQAIKSRKPPRKGHFVALVAIGRDFITNVLYDMWRYHRPFFVKVEDYRQYLRTHPRDAAQLALETERRTLCDYLVFAVGSFCCSSANQIVLAELIF